MLLLSSPRNGRFRRASLLLPLLLLVLVLLSVIPTGAGLPAGLTCPDYLDCAQMGRQFCQPGSSWCGPCLPRLREDDEGRCVPKKRHHQPVRPDLDEEIDFLHSVIEKQELSEVKTAKGRPSHPATTTPQTDAKKTQTDVPKKKSKSQHPTTKASGAAGVTAHPKTQTHQPAATRTEDRAGPIVVPAHRDDTIIVIIVSVCVVAGTVAVILATICFVKLQRESRLAQKVDYPGYGGAGAPAAKANGPSMGDKTLAQSAQMYHYQHQKQQMLSMGKQKPEQKVPDTDVTSDEEEVGGDFTVYECPGLAPTGEMEVKNPLFDDSTLQYQGDHK
ncbi:neural proliferation differentiation and control protein 1a isoform X2 [Sphaeramia orbicularis]|uniref:Neural proliferation differentiation and control protein 1-like n=1 Tax=Sphaeramia orbicularis TaxID=375764 RepID=A0A673BBE2_9TELE|nr:neural proliferation differentiation and control protein 1-like isoform X2 [Sphaeramia orbicularis]